MGIRRHIPNAITSMNLLCGVLGVIFTFEGRFDQAFFLMIAAAVFDFLDGFAARLLGAYSDMGKELDSLADMVSFGVLPSVMLVNLMSAMNFARSAWDLIPVVIAVASGLRLAKFNVDERQSHSFLGLPTPACAMVCGSLCYFISCEPASFLSVWALGHVFIPVLSVVLAALLVSETPMFSLKFSREDDRALRSKRLSLLVSAAIIVAVVALTGQHWSLAVLLTFVVYILMNVCFRLFRV